MNKKLPDIYNIRRALEDCIEKKLKGKRYNIEINDITNDK